MSVIYDSKAMENSAIKTPTSSEGFHSPTLTQVDVKVSSTDTNTKESAVAVAVLVHPPNTQSQICR